MKSPMTNMARMGPVQPPYTPVATWITPPMFLATNAIIMEMIPYTRAAGK